MVKKKQNNRIEFRKELFIDPYSRIQDSSLTKNIDFLDVLEHLITRIPELYSQVSALASDTPDNRQPHIVEMQRYHKNITGLLESLLHKLPQPLQEDVIELSMLTLELGQHIGSHNQWVVDAPFLLKQDEQAQKRKKTASEKHWKQYGYPILTGLDIAGNFYSTPENSIVRVKQLAKMIDDLYKKHKKPRINIDSLAEYIKEQISIPEKAKSHGSPRLTKEFVDNFERKYEKYLNNNHIESIDKLFTQAK